MDKANSAFSKLLIKAKPFIEETQKKETSGDKSVADMLVELTIKEKCELFLDEYLEPYISLPETPFVAYRVKSSIYRRWLGAKRWELEQKGFSSDVFNQVVNSLESMAFSQNKIQQLYNRVAKVNDVIYYDLCTGKVVKIDKDEWTVTYECPVKFLRFPHQRPQVEPQKGGNYKDILPFINIKKEAEQLLFLVHPIASLIPDIPRAALMNVGDKGSGKTTALVVIRHFIDPSSAPVLQLMFDIKEVVLNASKHYALFYDNLSFIPDYLSDTFSSLVTGNGLEKRKLYTDDESVIFSKKALLGFSAIPLVATRPDLLERLLILQFEHIPENERETEEKFWERLEALKAKILGGLFDILSATLRIKPTLNLPVLPRLADYATYGAAAATALGYSAEEYLYAFMQNVNRQNQSALEVSSIAQVIIEFMQNRDEKKWEGSSSDLYALLKPLAENAKLDIGGRDGFPKSSNKLWGAIKPIRTNLMAIGITATHRRSRNHSIISIIKTPMFSNSSLPEDEDNLDEHTQSQDDFVDTATSPEDTNSEMQVEQSENSGSDNEEEVDF